MNHSSPRRTELLDLAERVLEEDGLEAFGIGSLARAAGVKPPSLYKHFSGLNEIEDALIARSLRSIGESMSAAFEAAAPSGPRAVLAAFARTYRASALANPQGYRLATARPLRRESLEPGVESEGMRPLLELFGEDERNFDRSRAAWAWAHGLVDLELTGRFPPGVDIDATWDVLVDALAPFLPREGGPATSN